MKMITLPSIGLLDSRYITVSQSTPQTLGSTGSRLTKLWTSEVNTPLISSAGAVGITPASGSNLNITLATTGDLAVNTNQLYVDTSTGNVGIGTTAPGYKLEIASSSTPLKVGSDFAISGNVTYMNDLIAIGAMPGGTPYGYVNFGGTPGSDGNTTLYSTTGNILNLGSGGTSNRLSISSGGNFNFNSGQVYVQQSSGNVGIGTTAPGGMLDVYGATASILTRTVSGAAAPDSAIQIGLKSTTPTVGGGPSFLFFDNNSAGTKSFLGRLSSVWENKTAGSEAASIILSVRANTGDTTASTERLRVLANGNVGIGTTAPQNKLHLNNSGVASNYMQVTNSTSGVTSSDGTLYGIDSAANAIIWNYENTALSFATNNGEKMRITNGGNVGIGTTAPADVLDVRLPSNVNGQGLTFSAPNSSGPGSQPSLVFRRYDSGSENTRAYIGNGYGNGTSGGDLFFSTSPSSAATTPVVRLLIDSEGIFKFNDAGSNTTLMNAGNYSMFLGVNNATVMTLKSGNVGIGTTAPATKLQVVGGLITASGGISSPSNTASEIFGYGASSAHNYNVIVGYNASSTSVNEGNSVVVGYGATSTSSYGRSVVVGTGAISSADETVVIGRSASAATVRNVSIGNSANAATSQSVAIGYSAITNSGGTAIGYGTSTTGDSAVAFGANSTAGRGGVAIGSGASAGSYDTIAIGADATTNAHDNSIVIGRGAAATAVSQLVFGSTSYPVNKLYFGDDMNSSFDHPLSDTFAWTTGGTERLRIDSTGNVGIGTTAPDKVLEVNLGTASALRLTYNDANGSAATYMDTTVSSVGLTTFTATGSAPAFALNAKLGLKGYTVAALPTGAVGDIVYVTDQLTAEAAKGVAPTGGGAVKCVVFHNGTAWVGI